MISILDNLKANIARYLPYLLMLGGTGLVFLSVAVDYIGLGSSEGFGGQQRRLAVIGLAVVLVGVVALPVFLSRLTAPSSYSHQDSTPSQRLTQVLVIGLWFGLLMGFSDLLYFANLKYVVHEVLRFGPSLIWMAPVAGVLIAGGSALILGLVAFRLPMVCSMRVVISVLGFLGISHLLFNINALSDTHPIAVLILGLVIGGVIARPIANRSSNFYGFARRTLVGLVAIFVITTVGIVGWSYVSEARGRSALPVAEAGSPNVLLITLDTVRARSLGLYGYNRPTTPNLDEFAQEGVTFDWAISPAPWTLPAHASMLTGRLPNDLSTGFAAALDDTHPVVAEALALKGYENAGFVANHFYLAKGFGIERGFVYYQDFEITWRHLIRSSSLAYSVLKEEGRGRINGGFRGLQRQDAGELNRAFLKWVDDREDSQRPFFAFINYFDAHDPYLPPAEWALKFSGKEKPQSDWEKETVIPEEEIRELNDAYDASIAYLDFELGVLFNDLEQRGILDSTLVVITSDHGEQFGEHGLMEHANSLYLPLTHVPLIVRLPDSVPADFRVSDPVSLIDIPNTILDLAGVEDESTFPGQSLSRFWEQRQDVVGPKAGPVISEVKGQDWVYELYPVQKGDMRSLAKDDLYYIENGDGVDELYDIVNDPLELDNLAEEPDSQAAVDKYRSILEETSVTDGNR